MRGNIEIIASGFTGNYGHCNGTHNIGVSKADIFRSLLTVGTRGTRDFLSLPWHVLRSRRGRAIFTRNFITVDHGNWVIRDDYRTQDRSEKAVLSYWLGLSLSKVVAGRFLDTAWLAHVDALIEDNVITPSNQGGRRPDLAGPDRTNNWHVVEAKGRSVFIEPDLMQTAKNQALMIHSANGVTPVTRSGCIVKLNEDPISVELEDPDENIGKVRWEIDIVEFYNKYYSFIIEHLQNNEISTITIGQHSFRVARLRLFGQELRIGLLGEILEHPSDAVKYAVMLSEIPEYEKDRPAGISLGRDGSYLEITGEYD